MTFKLSAHPSIADSGRKTSRIYLLQSADQVLAVAQAELVESVLVALTPAAMFALERCGLRYHVPEDFCSLGAVYELGSANCDRAERIAWHLDDVLDRYPGQGASGSIRPGQCAFYELKILLDVISVRTLELHSLARALGPGELVTWPAAPIIDKLYENIRHRTRYSVLVPQMSLPVSLIAQPSVDSGRPGGSTKAWRRWLATKPFLFGALSAWRWHSYELSTLLRTVPSLFAKRSLLLIGDGYQWFTCVPQLASSGYAFLRLADGVPIQKSSDASSMPAATVALCLEELERRPEFLALFDCGFGSFYSAFRPCIRDFLENTAVACWQAAARVEQLVEEHDVEAILTTCVTSPTTAAMVTACRQKGVPSLRWQHGSAGHYRNSLFPFSDLQGADTYLAFGPGVRSCYEADADRLKVEIKVVGAHLQPRNRSRQRDAKRTVRRIVYITTNYFEDMLYIANRPAFSDRLFWRTQSAILHVLGRQCQPGDEVIIKLHPSKRHLPPPLEEQARAAGYHVRFVRDGTTVVDLVQEADATVIDWPQTTLLEALTTQSELFVYLGHLEMLPQAQRLLERRAHVDSDLVRFTGLLERFMKREPLPVVSCLDRSFVEQYFQPQEPATPWPVVEELVNRATARAVSRAVEKNG